MGADINAIQELSDILLLGQARPRAPPPLVKLKLLLALRICSKPSTTNRITQAKSLKTKKPAQLFASVRKQVVLYHLILSNVYLNACRYRSYKRFTVDPTFCFIIYFQQMLQVHFSLVFQRNSSQTWVPLIIFPFWGPGWWIKAAERPANSISALWITNSSWGQASQSSQSTQKGRWGTTLGKAKKKHCFQTEKCFAGSMELKGCNIFLCSQRFGEKQTSKKKLTQIFTCSHFTCIHSIRDA